MVKPKQNTKNRQYYSFQGRQLVLPFEQGIKGNIEPAREDTIRALQKGGDTMPGLEDLLVSGMELDRELLASVLSPFTRIDKEAIQPRFTPKWRELDVRGKIGVYLLASKAMTALGLLPAEEEATPYTQICKETGIKEGTVAPTLARLRDERLVDQTATKKYFVPNFAIEFWRASLESLKGGKKSE